jgi:hypothetical protein
LPTESLMEPAATVASSRPLFGNLLKEYIQQQMKRWRIQEG